MSVITEFGASNLSNTIRNIDDCVMLAFLCLVFVILLIGTEMMESGVKVILLAASIIAVVSLLLTGVATTNIKYREFNFSVIKIEEEDALLDLKYYDNVIPIGDDLFIVRPAVSESSQGTN